MKSKDNNSIPESQSLLKAVDKPCNVDKEFLDRLSEISVQEFELVVEGNDAKHPGIESKWRHIMKNRTTQLTSAAAILIAALVGMHMIMGPVPVTFAKVVEPILNAATISYDFIVGDETDGVVLHDIVTEDRIRRTVGGSIMILDSKNEKMLTLDQADKTAAYLDFKGPLKEGTQVFIDFIRETINKLQANDELIPENLGKKEINGKEVIGFRAGGTRESIVIWADAKTAIPVQIEMGMAHQDFIIKNLEFNIPVDASLVSMDVPDGYTLVETNLDLSSATEEDFINGLKVWVKIVRDGRYPDAMDPETFMKDIPVMEQKVGALDMPEEEAANLGVQYIKGMMFLNLFPVQGNSDLNYVGKGITYGDGDTPVIWYRPKDSDNYRVIYADLSVREVTPDELPK